MNSKKIAIIISVAVIAIVGSIWFIKSRHSSLPKYIPKTASGVIKINPLSMGRKIDFDAIKKMRSYQPFTKSFEGKSKNMAKFLENPSKIGMSFTDNIYIFGSDLIESTEKSVGLVFGVSDAEMLKTFIESFAKDANLEFEKSGNLNIYKSKNTGTNTTEEESEFSNDNDNQFAIVWNDEACLVYYAGTKTLSGAKKIMTQSESNSIRSMASFENSESEGGDMSVYIHYSKGMNSMTEYISMPQKLKKQVANIEAAAFMVSFNDQDISTNFIQYYKDNSLAQEFQILQNGGLSKESLEFISPNGKILLGLASMLDMPNIIKLLNSLPEAKSTMKELASTTGMSIPELESLFDGSLSIALTKLSSKEIQEPVYDYENINPETGEFAQSTQTVTKIIPIFTAQLGFQNEKTLNKLLKFIETKGNGMIQANNNIMSAPIGFFGTMHCVHIGNKLVFTNDDENAKILAKNKTWNNQLDKEISAIFADYPSSFYLDLNPKNYGVSKICTGLHIPEESPEMKLFMEVMSNFNNMQIKGNNKTASMSLNFTKSSDNSIMKIMKIADQIATTMRKRQVEREAAQRQLEMEMEQAAIQAETSGIEEMQ